MSSPLAKAETSLFLTASSTASMRAEGSKVAIFPPSPYASAPRPESIASIYPSTRSEGMRPKISLQRLGSSLSPSRPSMSSSKTDRESLTDPPPCLATMSKISSSASTPSFRQISARYGFMMSGATSLKE